MMGTDPPFLDALGNLRADFEAYYSKTDHLSTREEVALLSAVRDLALRRARDADSGDFRCKGLALWTEARDIMGTDPDRAGRALNDLGEHLRRGAAEDQALGRAVDLIERVAKRKEVQQGHAIKAAGQCKLESVRGVIRRVIEIARAMLPADQAHKFEVEVVRELRGELRISAPARGEA